MSLYAEKTGSSGRWTDHSNSQSAWFRISTLAYKTSGSSGSNGEEACRFQNLLVVQPRSREFQTDQLTLLTNKLPGQDGFGTYALVVECIPFDEIIRVVIRFDSSVLARGKAQLLLFSSFT